MAKDEKPRERKTASRQTHAVFDRLEDGDMAVLMAGEDGKTQVDVPISLLPKGAEEGDRLRITIMIDRDSRNKAEERITQLQEELKQQSGTEDKKDFKL
jgi:hypothetical protein